MILRLLQCRLIGLTSPYPLVPLYFCFLVSFTWYLAFLAADWSRTVSASPLNCFILPAPFWSCSTPLCLRLLTEGVTTLPPPFIDLSLFSLSCLLVCWVRLSFRVIGLCSFVSFAFFCSACFLLSLSLSLLALSCSLSVLRYPWVLCLVFLAADWSGFPAPPPFPPFFSSASLPW